MHVLRFFSLFNTFIIIINISLCSFRHGSIVCTQKYLRNTIYNSNNARGVVIVYVKKLIFSGDCGIFNIRIS